MNRRTVIKALAAAPLILSGFSKKGFTSESRAKIWPERLYLVNPVSVRRFEMLLKGDAPIRSASEVNISRLPPGTGCILELDRADNPRVSQYIVICATTDAVALTGIRVEGSPDVRISVTIDGEFILRDADPAGASAAEIKPMDPLRTDIFPAETPQKVKAGIFLPNGTMICVFAPERGPIPTRVRLETALYTSKI